MSGRLQSQARMRPTEAAGCLGKPVDDLYGRRIGVVVGFSIKTNGDVDSLGVDQGSGRFAEIASERLVAYERSYIVVPTWKTELIRVTEETTVLRNRLLALQELSKDAEDGGAPGLQYDQLAVQYRGRLAKIRESRDKLLKEIDARMEELDRHDQAMARFLVNVNTQFRSGEMTEASFHLVREQCGGLKAKNSKEREELAGAHAALLRRADSEVEEQQARPEPPRPERAAEREREDLAARDSVLGFVKFDLGDWKGGR